jgi:MscS family membrane protein
MLYCFMVAGTWNDEMRARTHLNLAILQLAEELGVSFAFPTQTVHIDSLAELGKSNPSHSGRTSVEDLVEAVEAFGPDGGKARTDFELSRGYRCDE